MLFLDNEGNLNAAKNFELSKNIGELLPFWIHGMECEW